MKELYNTYLFKALENYPYNLSETIESLHYAISYDGENPKALALLAKLYAEQLNDYENAKRYYEMALESDIYAVFVYPDYIALLIWIEEYEKAEKLISFALTLKGMDKGLIYFNYSFLHEIKGEYEKALSTLKEAKKHTYNSHFMPTINETKNRIKDKMLKKKKIKKENEK